MNNTIEKPRRILPYFAAVALVEFIIYYVLSLVAQSYDAVYYYLLFAERLIFLAVPVIAAAIIIRLCDTVKRTLITVALISLTRAIFLIPFLYIEYVYGPYDSVEAITLSLLTTVITVAAHALIVLLLWWLMRLIIKRRGGELSFPLPYFRFDNGASLSLIIISFAVFAINFIVEVISTVTFFIDNGTAYYADEIILIVFSYVYLILMFLAIHLGSCFLVNKCVKQVAISEIEE